jgi:bifunctional non-homologous end joining protein LigD
VRTEHVWAGNRAGDIEFCVCDDLPTLVWLAQLAAIELHPSLAKVDDVERPTVLAFDLDPGEPATIVECCAVALRLRALFADFGLDCFPKTSGSKGMQVYLPLNGDVTYENTKPYANAVAKALESDDPDLVTSQMKKALRPGKVFVDWSQNSATKTTVAVYSLRARSAPTASTPLHWEVVEATQKSGEPDDLRFTSDEVLARVEEHGDLFAPVLELRQELPTSP